MNSRAKAIFTLSKVPMRIGYGRAVQTGPCFNIGTATGTFLRIPPVHRKSFVPSHLTITGVYGSPEKTASSGTNRDSAVPLLQRKIQEQRTPIHAFARQHGRQFWGVGEDGLLISGTSEGWVRDAGLGGQYAVRRLCTGRRPPSPARTATRGCGD